MLPTFRLIVMIADFTDDLEYGYFIWLLNKKTLKLMFYVEALPTHREGVGRDFLAELKCFPVYNSRIRYNTN